jgi:hypothetical protein
MLACIGSVGEIGSPAVFQHYAALVTIWIFKGNRIFKNRETDVLKQDQVAQKLKNLRPSPGEPNWFPGEPNWIRSAVRLATSKN